MNLYDLHEDPSSLYKHSEADKEVPHVFWEKSHGIDEAQKSNCSERKAQLPVCIRDAPDPLASRRASNCNEPDVQLLLCNRCNCSEIYGPMYDKFLADAATSKHTEW